MSEGRAAQRPRSTLQHCHGCTVGVLAGLLLLFWTGAAGQLTKMPTKLTSSAQLCCRYPVDYYESMNTVLCQELVRFNRLIVTIHTSLSHLQKALKGMQGIVCCNLLGLGLAVRQRK